jgi:hypothetical protein
MKNNAQEKYPAVRGNQTEAVGMTAKVMAALDRRPEADILIFMEEVNTEDDLLVSLKIAAEVLKEYFFPIKEHASFLIGEGETFV